MWTESNLSWTKQIKLFIYHHLPKMTWWQWRGNSETIYSAWMMIMNLVWHLVKKFSKSNLNELVDDQVGIAEAQPQRDQMQPSLPAFLACCWWSSWLGSLPLVVTTSKSCSLPLASDGKCSVGIVHHLCIKGNVYDPKASAELMYRWSCANSHHYVAYFWVVGFCWKRWCFKR